MRLVFVTLFNLLRFLLALPGLPGRLLRRRRRVPYVRYSLTGDFSYRKQARRSFPFFGRSEEPATVQSLEALRAQVDLLAKDPRVKGLLFEVEHLEISGAKRQALAEVFASARRAGKELLGYAVTANTREYAVLCELDVIWMPSAGRLELVGFAAEATALGAGLKRLGVTPHFVRRGEHKTAPELFTEETISKIQRQTLDTFLDERYADLLSSLVRGRRLSEDEARRRIDEGPYSARRALAQGLIDGLVSEANIPERLAARVSGAQGGAPAGPSAAKDAAGQGAPHAASPVGTPPTAGASSSAAPGAPGTAAPDAPPPDPDEEDEEALRHLGTFEDYAASLVLPPKRRWRSVKRPPQLGLVSIDGIIGEGDGGFSPLGRLAGSDPIIHALRAAARDRRSKAIVLFIDCPGGSAIASEIVLEEVKRAARFKPVVAYVDALAASGGYMAACGAKEIWAAPQAVVGSIGVFAGKFELSGLMQRFGVHRLILTRGENAGLHSVSRGFTPHELAAMELDVEETYQAFLEHVAAARRMSKEAVHQRAEGRVFSGAQAVAQGLVEGTSGFEQTCRRALELAGVKGEPFHIESFTALPRRLPLPTDFFQLARAQVWALAWPWISWPG